MKIEMKKGFFLALLLVLLLVFAVGCSNGDDGSDDSGGTVTDYLKLESFTAEETEAVEKILEECGIIVKQCEQVVPEEGSASSALAAVLQTYDITAENGKQYRISVNSELKMLLFILDSDDSAVIYSHAQGILDSGTESDEQDDQDSPDALEDQDE